MGNIFSREQNRQHQDGGGGPGSNKGGSPSDSNPPVPNSTQGVGPTGPGASTIQSVTESNSSRTSISSESSSSIDSSSTTASSASADDSTLNPVSSTPSPSPLPASTSSSSNTISVPAGSSSTTLAKSASQTETGAGNTTTSAQPTLLPTSSSSMLFSVGSAPTLTFLNAPSPSSDNTQASLSQNRPNVGAIAGGVIGGVILTAALVLLSIFLIRRRRRNHTAPSAEFLSGRLLMDSPLTIGPSRAESFNSATFLRSGGVGHSSLNRVVSNEDDFVEAGQPPAFTPGNFTYPFPEKLNLARAS